MKKLLLLSAFLIFGCSDDSSDTNDDNSNNYKLVETYQYSYVNNDPNSDNFGNLYETTASYSYDGNKLLNITISNNNGSGTVNYTYNENNKISGVYFAGGDVGEAEYDNQGRLVTWTYTDVDDNPVGNPSIGVANFVYNQDNSVVQTWSLGSSFTYLFDQNGNITTITNPDAWDGNTEKNFTYDNKNNPFKNILGNGFFINIWFQGLSLNTSINNNIITAENENNIFFYTYDEDDYPISFNSPNGFDYKSNIQVNITYTN